MPPCSSLPTAYLTRNVFVGHIHPLYDLTVGAFIEHNKRLLLVFHKKLQVWICIGGHVEMDEDPEMALWREIFEETGLTKHNLQLIDLAQERPEESSTGIKILPIPFDFTVYFVGTSKIHRHIDLAYLLKSKTDKITHNINESTQYSWFSLHELEAIQKKMFRRRVN